MSPERPVPADWLALRRPADEAAREGTARLLGVLWRELRSRPSARPDQPVHLIDIGAGTGANQAWLAPRISHPVTWTLLDHDPDLLRQSAGTGQRVLGGVETVRDLIASSQAWADVLTCSALLDLLTYEQLDDLADVVLTTSTPGLFSLSVDGDVRFAPTHDDDARLAAAFEDHQRRGGLAGASAAAHLSQRLDEGGARVVVAATPWRLTAAHSDLMVRYLTDRAAVAVEQDHALGPTARSWLRERLAQHDAGALAVVVGHVDLLVLPPPRGHQV